MRPIVADSNVFISALVYGGKPLEILELGLEREIHLFMSPEILAEILDVLRHKFLFTTAQLDEARLHIEAVCFASVRPSVKLDVVTDDPDDNKVLELAVQITNSVIVTGDRHLLRLQMFEGVKIQRPAEFMAEFESR